MTTVVCRFRGTDKNGRGRGGATTTTDLAKWIEARYRSGWRSLTVIRDGAEAGGTTRRDGRRIWWAEQ